MGDQLLTAQIMLKALKRLDVLLPQKCELVMGGGGAMILVHKFPLATTDIDAFPRGLSISELDPLVTQVARDLDLPGDWLNPYFSTFTHVLPADFSSRLHEVFVGKSLTVRGLGAEDMLIMKCCAHRRKDVAHARALLKAGVDLKLVEKQLEFLHKKNLPGLDLALDFFDEIQESV